MSGFAAAIMAFALGGIAGALFFGGGDSNALDSKWGRGLFLFVALFVVGGVALELSR